MARRCAEAVEVRRRDDDPEQFLWRGRLYQVREILSTWVESGRWWSRPQARPLFGASSDDPPGGAPEGLIVAAIPAAPKWGQRAWGEPAPDVGTAVGSATVDDGERQFWRVEAGAGRSAGTGVYDLCFDWGAATWTVARVLD